jgi:hypothetical protein
MKKVFILGLFYHEVRVRGLFAHAVCINRYWFCKYDKKGEIFIKKELFLIL